MVALQSGSLAPLDFPNFFLFDRRGQKNVAGGGMVALHVAESGVDSFGRKAFLEGGTF